MFSDDGSLWVWSILPFVLLYAVGVWLGAHKKIVVFRSTADVFVVGLLVIIPAAAIGILSIFVNQDTESISPNVVGLFLVLELLAFVFIVVRTSIDNKNPLKIILALYVKLISGLLFFFLLKDIFGNNSRSMRRKNIFWVIVLVPLLYALIDNSNDKNI